MLSLYVSVPIACFRPGAAREFWETHPLPPPSTVYGFLLSLVGETDRERHLGVRCTAGLLNSPERSTVLRKMWRVKELGGKSGVSQGNATNVRPDFQQLLTGIRLVVFVDSTDERNDTEKLEQRISIALDPGQRGKINRFGGLSLGESTHMVDEVSFLASSIFEAEISSAEVFLNDTANGNMTLPVWVDHVGGAGTKYATGRISRLGVAVPLKEQIPLILNSDPDSSRGMPV